MYWFAEHNPKKNTTRYTCCERITKECKASITVNAKHCVVRETAHNHIFITDAKRLCEIAEKEAKEEVKCFYKIV